uniref:Uncharacterized protein n=1 Tax=Ditylenchus dipsaci TaxID=166011 RepID=A0A915DDN8_9BILA
MAPLSRLLIARSALPQIKQVCFSSSGGAEFSDNPKAETGRLMKKNGEVLRLWRNIWYIGAIPCLLATAWSTAGRVRNTSRTSFLPSEQVLFCGVMVTTATSTIPKLIGEKDENQCIDCVKMTGSPVCKDLGNGTMQCNICSLVVKAKVWTAHQGLAKENSSSNALPSVKASFKRKLAEDAEARLDVKRFEMISRASNSRSAIPPNSSSFNAETPWQAAQRAAAVVAEAKPVIFSKVEGVPLGFFDADREQKISNKHPHHDSSKFLSASKESPVVDIEGTEEEKEDEEAEKSTFLKHDIEFIDEQIEAWKRVSRLEKLKEEVTARLIEKNGQEATLYSCSMPVRFNQYPDMQEDDSEGSDENEGSKYGQDIDWRIRDFM